MRMLLVMAVALVNLGLGFVIALKAGRGPWSPYARRQPTNPQPCVPSAPRQSKSIEQIAGELELLEHRFQELLQQLKQESNGQITVEGMKAVVQESVAQVESLAVDELASEHPEQASAGLRVLLLELQTAATELAGPVEQDENGSPGQDLSPLVTRLLMSCRQVSAVFNALMFAELPN
jgi:hypothetical protein